jgi:hypothetical protein
MTLDRMSGNELHLTHEQVSIFLGVRRESITMSAQNWKPRARSNIGAAT